MVEGGGSVSCPTLSWRQLKVVKAVCYHQILFRFRDCFAEVGRGYMDEFLNSYSDSVLLAA